MCLISDQGSRCGIDISIFGITDAEFFLYLFADGFIGLGNGLGWGGDETTSLNTLEQMLDRSMITKKQFGVQITERGDSKNNSTIRFGGYDLEKLEKGHNVVFIDTIDSKAWMLPLMQVDFATDDILGAPTQALINPGYPYIAAPLAEFEKFKDDLRKAFP